ncbi:MarR family winged helix-turn-helix transcriptional regulator [Loktanella salsilacus]|uniref:MarR family winged helix-turn-helix transcriptional regulator n=1 Tax=Loktanella salsilacus TaxID=195913 RepID=UPI0030033891
MTHDLPPFDLDGFVPYLAAATAQKLSAQLAAGYQSRFGISIAEWRILVNVGYVSDASVRDIEQRVGLEKSKASRAASRLVAKGYVSKTVDLADRRLIKLALTDKGADLLRQIVPIAKDHSAALEQTLMKDHAVLQRILKQLLQAL